MVGLDHLELEDFYSLVMTEQTAFCGPLGLPHLTNEIGDHTAHM